MDAVLATFASSSHMNDSSMFNQCLIYRVREKKDDITKC